MKKKTLNILSSEIDYYVIKEFKRDNNNFDGEDFLIVNLSLFIGDIRDLKNGSIREIYNYKTKINNEILNNDKEYETIRIWSSRIDSDDYLSMLYCLNVFKNKNLDIRIIFTDDLKHRERNGEESCVWSLSYCSTEEIPKLLSLEKKLSSKEYIKYLDEWNKSVEENKPLRIMRRGVLKGIDYSFFDKYIFDALKKNKQLTKIDLCVQVIINNRNEIGNIGDVIIMTRIDELIGDKKIRIVGKKTLDYYSVGEPLEKSEFMENKRTLVELET